jgi:predicted Rossmann-fold nucleotide-binding protein
MHITEIHTLDGFRALPKDIADVVCQHIDFSGADIDWDTYTFEDVVFLGCKFGSRDDIGALVERGALVFPHIPGLPYRPYREVLYTPDELHAQVDEQRSHDLRIYEHFEQMGRHEPHVLEALAQRIHDHAIDDALRELIADKRVVGVMGGHSTRRDDPYFAKVARMTRLLTLEGYFVASGGGPGIMEAANLGAYFAAFSADELEDAIERLSAAPHYEDEGYDAAAREVRHEYPDGRESLAVPTWFYGHEPSNLFGLHVAKYFSNSIREDGLLAICLHGVVYAPGSAGTTQEIFMDAAQNHYGTFGWYSPMVFLGVQRYTEQTDIYPLIQQLADGTEYREFLTLTDSPREAVDFIEEHPPREVE